MSLQLYVSYISHIYVLHISECVAILALQYCHLFVAPTIVLVGVNEKPTETTVKLDTTKSKRFVDTWVLIAILAAFGKHNNNLQSESS